MSEHRPCSSQSLPVRSESQVPELLLGGLMCPMQALHVSFKAQVFLLEAHVVTEGAAPLLQTRLQLAAEFDKSSRELCQLCLLLLNLRARLTKSHRLRCIPISQRYDLQFCQSQLLPRLLHLCLHLCMLGAPSRRLVLRRSRGLLGQFFGRIGICCGRTFTPQIGFKPLSLLLSLRLLSLELLSQVLHCKCARSS